MSTCFICGKDAKYWHGNNDDPSISIRFCEDCRRKSEERAAILKQLRPIKNKTHLVVNGQCACQQRKDRIIKTTTTFDEVSCMRCCLSLYHFGASL